jgi:NADH-quinone oxidoreductase subunit G
MEGQPERPPSSLVPFYWTPGWNSVQAMYNYLDEPNGSMKGGDPGIRLIERAETPRNTYFSIMNSSEAGTDELTIISVYRLFGSEELSSASPSVAQRFKEPFVYINQRDADNAGISDGDMIRLEISGSVAKMKVKIENSLPARVAGLSVNLPGMPFFDIPGNGRLFKL